jgi:hypothetical protein
MRARSTNIRHGLVSIMFSIALLGATGCAAQHRPPAAPTASSLDASAASIAPATARSTTVEPSIIPAAPAEQSEMVSDCI